jgi:radical SAM protein with 4Fe4S-binding SPASM domain
MYDVAKNKFGEGYTMALNPIMSTKDTKGGLDNNLLKVHYKAFLEKIMSDTSKGALKERQTTTLVNSVIGNVENGTCSFTNCEGTWISVYSDGSIYPCDREMKAYRICHLDEVNSINEILEHENFKRYLSDIQKAKDTYCSTCEFKGICGARCKSDHACSNESGRLYELNTQICDTYKTFYRLVYLHIQSYTDDSPYNPYYKATFKHNGFISPLEIETYLETKGLTISMTLDGYCEVEKTFQHKLFRIFNPKRTTENPYNLQAETKLEMLNAIYNLKQEEIKQIIKD